MLSVDTQHNSAETFVAMGDETRIAILRELLNAPDRPLSFTELQDRVGAKDSGRFNYHLNKLLGDFIRKTEEGYDLVTSGLVAIRDSCEPLLV